MMTGDTPLDWQELAAIMLVMLGIGLAILAVTYKDKSDK